MRKPVNIGLEIDKKRAIELAQQVGLIVSFTNEEALFVTDGDARWKIKWEDVVSELENKYDTVRRNSVIETNYNEKEGKGK